MVHFSPSPLVAFVDVVDLWSCSNARSMESEPGVLGRYLKFHCPFLTSHKKLNGISGCVRHLKSVCSATPA